MTRRAFVVSAGAAAARGAAPPGQEWWLKPVRLFHPNMRESDVRGMDVRRFIADCAATNADGIVVSVAGFTPSIRRGCAITTSVRRWRGATS